MSLGLADQAILFIASFVANWFSALSGGGAGLIQLPMLIFLCLPFGVALGIGATLRHLKKATWSGASPW